MTYEQLHIGDTACMEKTISESDVYGFAGITGDFNPVHISKTHAEKSLFGERVAHGMLVGSLFSSVMAMTMPGPGGIYVSQALEFVAPVKMGDTIAATVTVTEKMAKRRVRLECQAHNQKGELVIRGEAIVLPSK